MASDFVVSGKRLALILIHVIQSLLLSVSLENESTKLNKMILRILFVRLLTAEES